MKKTIQEITEGMQGALNKVKGVIVDNSDESKKKLVGTGMAGQAADAIIKRKKATEDAINNS